MNFQVSCEFSGGATKTRCGTATGWKVHQVLLFLGGHFGKTKVNEQISGGFNMPSIPGTWISCRRLNDSDPNKLFRRYLDVQGKVNFMFQAEAATEEGSLDKAWSYRNGKAKIRWTAFAPGGGGQVLSDFFKTGSINQLVEVYWPITPHIGVKNS